MFCFGAGVCVSIAKPGDACWDDLADRPAGELVMDSTRLRSLLHEISRARVGVVGDFCVDAYHQIDADASEASLETGLPTHPVREQRHSLGGAGNVLANLRALGVTRLHAFGVIGPDPQGTELQRLLREAGADATGIIPQPQDWQTHSYLKPIHRQAELNRLDFGCFNRLASATCAAVLAALERALPELDALVINQQFERGLHTPEFQAGLNALLARHPRVIALVDCRHLAEAYPAALHKLNDLEAVRLAGGRAEPRTAIPRDHVVAAAQQLFRRWQRPVFVTRGAHGCLVADAAGVQEIPGLHLLKKTDSVGAGDSMVAGIAATLAAGGTAVEAATLGNFVAGVTVQKLHQTGTASPEEVLSIGLSPDYVYQPELAADPRRAQFVSDTEIEIAEPLPADLSLKYAIFDHDGTISTLRQGWEKVMEPVMIEAILGPDWRQAERDVYERVVGQVREFIDKTTGIQTLQQMHGLAQMVREAGFVPADRILDAHGYKRIYNDALMGLVEDRLARLNRGERDVTDYTLKNAVTFLQALHRAGLKLYLASGTDEQDVIREAQALGYADLFEGRIYGASSDMTHDAKRMVLDRILGDLGPANAARIVTFGDGPVEIRETRKRGGVTVGLASNEVQRFGLAPEKRTRVIRAGAHLVVPDFSQYRQLLAVLGIGN